MQEQVFLNVPIEEIHLFHLRLMDEKSMMDHIDIHMDELRLLRLIIDDKFHRIVREIDHAL